MFRNFSVQTKLVNDKKAKSSDPTTVNVTNVIPPNNFMRDAAVGIGALYAVKVAVDTTAKIALHVATK